MHIFELKFLSFLLASPTSDTFSLDRTAGKFNNIIDLCLLVSCYHCEAALIQSVL